MRDDNFQTEAIVDAEVVGPVELRFDWVEYLGVSAVDESFRL